MDKRCCFYMDSPEFCVVKPSAMKTSRQHPRIDSGSKLIKASPEKIYQAYMTADAIAKWRPPQGMTCHIYEFEPRQGGAFRMSFTYRETQHDVQGKTSAHEDVFHGRFLELVPGKRIVELVEFESADPAFAGEMKITTTLTPAEGGTEVNIRCEHVPEGIKPEDHQKGIMSTLNNLAGFTEQ
jgi:uncharacterized protein YndB with AHSA1/START domain